MFIADLSRMFLTHPTHPIPSQRRCAAAVRVLAALATARRFGMAVMFLNAADRAVIKRVCTEAAAEAAEAGEREAALAVAAADKVDM